MPSDEMVEKVARAICKSNSGDGWRCCQWPAQGGRRNCTAKTGAYDDGARAALAAAEAGVQPSLASYVSPNVYDGVRASPPSEVSRDERALLDQMGRHTNWELSCSGGWSDDPLRWTVHKVTGGRNDREWTVIGEGETPAEAIATATRARGET